MMQVFPSFSSLTLGDVLVAGSVLFAYLDWRVKRAGFARTQSDMHAENKVALARLTQFQEDQEQLNKQRDTQILELMKQTTLLGQVAAESQRRLGIIEERCYRKDH